MATNYFLNQYFTTTLNVGGGIDASQTTGIIVQAVSGLDITKPGIACITYADPINTSTAEWVTYTSIDGSNELQGVTRGAEGFGAKTHAPNAVVAFPVSESHINNLATALSIGGVATNAVSTTLDEDTMSSNSATALATQQSIKAYTDAQVATRTSSLYQQMIINGNFDVWQRGTSFIASAPNDDVYTADRWNSISSANDVTDVSQDAITDLPGSNYAYKILAGSTCRTGLVQFLEAKDAQKLKGKSVSISFAIKSATVTKIRAAVLSWGSTADSITSDVVGTWAATPTWATNWTAENTPADLTVTSSWTTVTVENIAIDSSTVNNIALAIWTPDELSATNAIHISQVQMNEGAVALPFQPKSFEDELGACERYYEVNKAITNNSCLVIAAYGGSATVAYGQVIFRTPKRAAPTLSSGGTIIISNGTTTTSITENIMNIYSATLNLNTAAGLTAGVAYYVYGTSASSAFIGFSAEL